MQESTTMAEHFCLNCLELLRASLLGGIGLELSSASNITKLSVLQRILRYTQAPQPLCWEVQSSYLTIYIFIWLYMTNNQISYLLNRIEYISYMLFNNCFHHLSRIKCLKNKLYLLQNTLLTYYISITSHLLHKLKHN